MNTNTNTVEEDLILMGWNVTKLCEDGANRWKKYGKDRIYIGVELGNKVMDLYVEYYKSGYIGYSELEGEEISHTKASKIIETYSACYIDLTDGKVHGFTDYGYKGQFIKKLKSNYFVGNEKTITENN